MKFVWRRKAIHLNGMCFYWSMFGQCWKFKTMADLPKSTTYLNVRTRGDVMLVEVMVFYKDKIPTNIFHYLFTLQDGSWEFLDWKRSGGASEQPRFYRLVNKAGKDTFNIDVVRVLTDNWKYLL